MTDGSEWRREKEFNNFEMTPVKISLLNQKLTIILKYQNSSKNNLLEHFTRPLLKHKTFFYSILFFTLFSRSLYRGRLQLKIKI